MKSRSLYILLVLCILSSLGLSSCQAADTLPVQAAKVEFVPQSVIASDCSQGNEIRAIRAEDQYTVTFELCSPDRTFPAKVGTSAFSIQEDSVLAEANGDPVQVSLSAVGTGPYKITEKNLAYIRLEKRSDYWGVPVRLRHINLTWNESNGVRLRNLTARAADGITAGVNDINTIDADPYLKVVESPVVNTIFLGMNNTIAPFDNLAIRQALAYAFDRDKIASQFFGPSALPAEQLVPLEFEIGHTNSLRWYDFNSKQTSDILRLNGFDFNQTLVLSFDKTSSSQIPDPRSLALEMAMEMRNAGVKVSLNPLDTDSFQQALLEGSLGLYFTAYEPEYPDANSFFETFFARDNPLIGKTDPAIAAEIQAALATSNLSSMQASYDLINQWVKDQVPLVPLAHTNHAYGFHNSIGSIIVGPFGDNFEQVTSQDEGLNFIQANHPGAFWPVDLSNYDTQRITRLIYDSLTSFDLTEMTILPGLAESWSTNGDFTEWTFLLRYDVTFSNGAVLDANDVVATFAAQADLANPNHREDVNYDYYQRFFGNFINQP